MANKYFFTIKDFWGAGRNFRTQIKSWSWGNTNSGSASLGGGLGFQTNELYITRAADWYSTLFSILSVLTARGTRKIFPEATLTLDFSATKVGVGRRLIYDLFEVVVIRHSVGGDKKKLEQIGFNCTKMSAFDIAVELIR